MRIDTQGNNEIDLEGWIRFVDRCGGFVDSVQVERITLINTCNAIGGK